MPCKTCISLRLLLHQIPKKTVARVQQTILMPTPATPLSITPALLPTPLQYTPATSPKHLLQHIFEVHPVIRIQTSATEAAVAMLIIIVICQMQVMMAEC